MIGTVKNYDSRRGMGALTPDGGGLDVQVFVSEVERAGLTTLAPGQKLSFGIQADRKSNRRFAVRLEML